MIPCLPCPTPALRPAPTAAILPSALRIRPVLPADAPLLGEFVRSLSPASRHRRFHAAVRELPPELLHRYATVDHQREMAFVAIAGHGADLRCVGEARFAAVEGLADTREFAVAVHDDLQRRGLATGLLKRLLHHAQAIGVRWLHGDVMRDNTPMRALAAKLGFFERRHPSDATLVRVIGATAAGYLQ